MMTVIDLMPSAGTNGGYFFIGLFTDYAVRKVLKITVIIIVLFTAALAYRFYKFELQGM